VFLPDGFTPLMIAEFGAPPPTPPEDPPAPQPGTIYFVHNDHLATPKAVTDLTGTPVWQARHQPFGQVQPLCGPNGVPNPSGPPAPGPCTFSQLLRFPGQWDQSDAHLSLAGVWYNWHRFYLPQWGMYSRRDPISREEPSPYRTRLRGLDWTFHYVQSNPLTWADPFGLWEMPSSDQPFPTDPMQDLFGPLGSPDDYLEYRMQSETEYGNPSTNPEASPFQSWDHRDLIQYGWPPLVRAPVPPPGRLEYCAERLASCYADCDTLSVGGCSPLMNEADCKEYCREEYGIGDCLRLSR